MVDIFKVGGSFATADFSLDNIKKPIVGSCSAGNFTSKAYFWVFFFTKFEAGIAKNQNVGDNSFFLN